MATVSFQNRYLCRDGRHIWLEWIAVPERANKVIYAIARDVTERRAAAEALAASEERVRLILDRALEAFIAIDDGGRVTDWNARAAALFGWSREEAIGQRVSELVIPPDQRAAHEAGLVRYLQTGEGPVVDRRIELTAQRRDGTHFPIEISIAALRAGGTLSFNAFLTDITDRRAAHEQHIQTAKLASLGEMVAGVAHEINNPLSYVSNNVAVLHRDLGALAAALRAYRAASDTGGPEATAAGLAEAARLFDEADGDHVLGAFERLFGRTRDGLKRIQQIVADLRNFARLDEAETLDADLNEGILSTVNIVRGRAKAGGVVDLELDLAPLPRVACHPARINQVVMNLLSNAIDASPEGGVIRVRTRAGGEAVTIEVLDQGLGVAPEIRHRIFDPFFTTKPLGAGTGLGLSISYGIVKEHGGTIAVVDAPGGGARFVVALPRRAPARP
jgi:PAS domain S-box-containing protein